MNVSLLYEQIIYKYELAISRLASYCIAAAAQFPSGDNKIKTIFPPLRFAGNCVCRAWKERIERHARAFVRWLKLPERKKKPQSFESERVHQKQLLFDQP